jgi:hypothetical protein
VLDELSAAWTALRLGQARCYRALAALQASDVLGESGYRYPSRLLEDQLRIDPAEATRLARHARCLAVGVAPSGESIPAELPATASKVSAGVIGPGHVEVIRGVLRRLAGVQPALSPEVLDATETELAELATTHSPAALAAAAKAIEALLDPDGTAPDDTPPADNELHYLRRRNGTLVGRFTYRDPAAAETLHTALAAATPPPDTVPDDRPHPGTGPRGYSNDDAAARTLPARRAHALLELATEALTHGPTTPDHTGDPAPEHHRHDEETSSWDLLDHPDTEPASDSGPADEDTGPADEDAGPAEDREPTGERSPTAPPRWTRADVEGGERVALTVTLNYPTLRQALSSLPDPTTQPGDGHTGRLALLGENTWIRPETARRLACDADLIPIVLGSTGEPLDLGRKHRLVPTALRRAVIARDRHCAHPGCRRRARRCQVHHIRHWADHGETSLVNCVLLCSYHHGLVHHADWQIHMIDGQPWFTPPAYIDPHRRPRHNRPWQTTPAV